MFAETLVCFEHERLTGASERDQMTVTKLSDYEMGGDVSMHAHKALLASYYAAHCSESPEGSVS